MTGVDSTLVSSCYPYGVMISQDGGQSWSTSSTGLLGAASSSMAALSSTVFASLSGLGIGRSTDGGNSWTNLSLPVSMGSRVSVTQSVVDTNPSPPFLSEFLFAGTQTMGLWVSTDRGDTWNPAGTGLEYTLVHDVKAIPSSSTIRRVYVGTSAGVGISKDGGGSWTTVVPSANDQEITSIDVQDSLLIAGAYHGHVYRSTDDGKTWNDWTGTHGGQGVYSLVIQDTTVFLSDYTTIWKRGLRSSDWSLAWHGKSDPWQTKLYPVQHGLLGCTQYWGPEYLPMNDTVWVHLGPNTPLLPALSATVVGSTLYLGTWNQSVWKGDFASILTGVESSVHAPVVSCFKLEQNYPNPCNPSTNIGYTIASSKEQVAGSTKQVGMERVRLVVYDLLGREVAVLVDGYQTPGEHRVTFDARKLASGVYFYRLVAGGAVQTRKMALVR